MNAMHLGFEDYMVQTWIADHGRIADAHRREQEALSLRWSRRQSRINLRWLFRARRVVRLGSEASASSA
jgi:hypothetical protein